jgi:hypothetical protein
VLYHKPCRAEQSDVKLAPSRRAFHLRISLPRRPQDSTGLLPAQVSIMGKDHAGSVGRWFAAVRKVFRPSSSSKDKDAAQHGGKVCSPPFRARLFVLDIPAAW